ncbi:MAG TPA: hypothetical protein VIT45_01410 [Allosphingosinicella sp.]
MGETATALVWAGGAVAAISILCFAGLKAWRGWLELRREEIAARGDAEEQAKPEMGARIELADVRERLRKLEAIARGVDL